ncbi:MAG: cobyrinate a,c-diamide synthase [Lachnospiraceae bacterium]|jgi:cobyrinic acid a,c-diamide synthase
MNRIMIAGTASGCGKTTITCAVLQAFAGRGLKVMSYKCGPDYIDPMFHTRIIGVPSRNLDGFFMDRDTIRTLLVRNSRGADISVMEGVMGFYDGLGMTDEGSSYALARDTGTPVVLVVNCRGMSRSIEAVISGFAGFKKDAGIAGVIFNQLPEKLYPAMQAYCERIGLRPLGFFPAVAQAQIGSRHLGLITAGEISDLKDKMQLLAQTATQYLDLDGIMEIAETAADWEPAPDAGQTLSAGGPTGRSGRLRLACAQDAAFCFYYEDNLDLLRALGCEIVPFSPIADAHLPAGIDGLYLGGGYPELYAAQLEQNRSMRDEVRQAAKGGMPVYAECGGFLYLHRTLQTPDGGLFEMAGALDGSCRFAGKLQHFGYVTLTAACDTVLCRRGEKIRAHEFHRYRSDLACNAFDTEKGQAHWMSGVSQGNLLGGFPHIHFYANKEFAYHFVQSCARRK